MAAYTEEQVIEANERYESSTENPGLCSACGAEADGCEPDAEGYPCEECGENAVDGTMTMLFKI